MSKHYPASLLRTLRNQIPIDTVIADMLCLDIRHCDSLLRFRCPLCDHFHTATNPKTNLARCFDCQKNFNPIDLVMTVTRLSFVEAVELLKQEHHRPA
jgi:DNA primase